jgi:hypothetical protein
MACRCQAVLCVAPIDHIPLIIRFGIEIPGLTSSLAIGETVADDLAGNS